ncbi:RidA family protein [Pseudomonadota bacterium AL_CKDN230030165-1A_HGKHYDSX7]
MADVTHQAAVEARLAEAGLFLPAPPTPRGMYAPFHAYAAADIVFVSISGQASREDGRPLQGRSRPGDALEPAQAACGRAALAGLAALKAACGGDLGRVRAITQLRGYVACEPGFDAHSAVLDGASHVIDVAFPDLARPARSAVGVTSLPAGCWAEVELSALIAP